MIFKQRIIIIIYLSLFLSAIIGCTNLNNQLSDEKQNDVVNLTKEQAVSVKYFVIKEQSFKKELLVNGRLEAIKRANIKFIADGGGVAKSGRILFCKLATFNAPNCSLHFA